MGGRLTKSRPAYFVLSLFSVSLTSFPILGSTLFNLVYTGPGSQAFWSDIEVFVISSFTSFLILLEFCIKQTDPKPENQFEALHDKSSILDESKIIVHESVHESMANEKGMMMKHETKFL